MLASSLSGRVPPGLGVEKRLAHTCDRARDRDLIRHFGVLARARRAFIHDLLAHRPKQRQTGCKIRFLAADHDGQRAVFRACVPARDRCIQHMQAARFPLCCDAHREPGVGGRHVDQVRALSGCRQDAVFAEIDLLHVLRVADHCDDRRPARQRTLPPCRTTARRSPRGNPSAWTWCANTPPPHSPPAADFSPSGAPSRPRR